jgi:hypothetical protein
MKTTVKGMIVSFALVGMLSMMLPAVTSAADVYSAYPNPAFLQLRLRQDQMELARLIELHAECFNKLQAEVNWLLSHGVSMPLPGEPFEFTGNETPEEAEHMAAFNTAQRTLTDIAKAVALLDTAIDKLKEQIAQYGDVVLPGPGVIPIPILHNPFPVSGGTPSQGPSPVVRPVPAPSNRPNPAGPAVRPEPAARPDPAPAPSVSPGIPAGTVQTRGDTPYVYDGRNWVKAVRMDPDGGVPKGTPKGTYVLMGDNSHLGMYDGNKVVAVAFDASPGDRNAMKTAKKKGDEAKGSTVRSPKSVTATNLPKLNLAAFGNLRTQAAGKTDRPMLLTLPAQSSGRVTGTAGPAVQAITVGSSPGSARMKQASAPRPATTPHGQPHNLRRR